MNEIKFEITAQSKRIFDDFIKDHPEQVAFASALALTRVAKVAQSALIANMNIVFNKPTPYTLRSTYTRPATKTRLMAEVGFRDWSPKGTAATVYLDPEVHGGQRQYKRSELLLRNKGLGNKMMAPGSGAQLDQYGNINRGQLVKVLSALQAQTDSPQNSTSASKINRYFIGKPRGGGRRYAVYERDGRKLKTIYNIIAPPNYSKRLKFAAIIEHVHNERMEYEFKKAMAQALLTSIKIV